MAFKPSDPTPLSKLVLDLIGQRAPSDAEAVCRTAIELQPDEADAAQNLALALKAQGKLEDSLAALRRASKLAAPDSPLDRSLPGRIFQVKQMIAVTGRLPAVLKGEDTPRDAAEVMAFDELCRDQGRYAAAARLSAAALSADPKLGDDRQAQHRYIAARSAAQAGCGTSRDDPLPDASARASLRQQALDWLKSEQVVSAQLLESGSPQIRAQIIAILKQWQQDPALAGVREGEELANLPDDERKGWQLFWFDVDALLKKAGGNQ